MKINVFTNIDILINADFKNIDIDPFWNTGDAKESRMHSIHAYPAKFPAFIAEKAIDYAKQYNQNISYVSDIFCGCGTVALEARKHGLNFWGCDINPVATLIAKVKSSTYSCEKLYRYYDSINKTIDESFVDDTLYETENERIKYWFSKEQYIDLKKIKNAIDILPNSKYKNAFLCLFSSILKPTSKWLTKSIKPQIDPDKTPILPRKAFNDVFEKFMKAVVSEQIESKSKITIQNCNFITKKKLQTVDLIITSPPYVTSYEYADLHQLSTLWLGFATNYTDLRKGTIGSVYNSEDYYFEIMDLNVTAKRIVQQLYDNSEIGNSKTKSVARYFIDMQTATSRCYSMLSAYGIACFVVGDTEYKGVKIENARHLVESLLNSGFEKVKVSKRIISNKTLSPYRDENGKFSSDSTKRKVYHEEYVIIAHKKRRETNERHFENRNEN